MGHKDITPGTFRVLESMHVPDDFVELCNTLEIQKKLSPAKLREVASGVLLRRWLRWSLEHPGLGADRIHPSRRVLPSSDTVVIVIGSWSFLGVDAHAR